MHDAELVGGVLFTADDPWVAAAVLAELLVEAAPDRDRAALAGLDPELVRVLWEHFGQDERRTKAACELGAAWVLGRRSATATDPWELVASLPAGAQLPTGLSRTTGETLIQLANESVASIRLAAPFMDIAGVSYLADALAGATARGVGVEMMLPTRSTHAADALAELRSILAREGQVANFRVVALRDDAPWAHLKALTSDSRSAYIGSANVTAAGLAGPNLELGILVRGPAVAVIDRVLDLFRER